MIFDRPGYYGAKECEDDCPACGGNNKFLFPAFAIVRSLRLGSIVSIRIAMGLSRGKPMFIGSMKLRFR